MTLTLTLNPYFLGCLLLFIPWLGILIYLWVKHDRSNLREFWWGSAVCALLGFSEPVYVPDYWFPPSLLSIGPWDLESFLFCFGVGGITAVLPEIPGAKRLFYWLDYYAWRLAQSIMHRAMKFLTGAETMDAPASEVSLTKVELRQDNMLFIALFLGTFGATAHLSFNIIYKTTLTALAMAIFIGWRAPRLRWQIVGGGASFFALYTLVLQVVARVYPDVYHEYWNLPALSGRWFLGAPVEEYLFAASFGMLWAPWYEVWKNERSVPPTPPRLLAN